MGEDLRLVRNSLTLYIGRSLFFSAPKTRERAPKLAKTQFVDRNNMASSEVLQGHGMDKHVKEHLQGISNTAIRYIVNTKNEIELRCSGICPHDGVDLIPHPKVGTPALE